MAGQTLVLQWASRGFWTNKKVGNNHELLQSGPMTALKLRFKFSLKENGYNETVLKITVLQRIVKYTEKKSNKFCLIIYSLQIKYSTFKFRSS